jgi:hypothetical protein
MALKPVDRVFGGYLGFVTVVILVRGPFRDASNGWMVGMHILFGVLLYLFTKLQEEDRIGQIIHNLYPLVMFLPLYTEIGLLNAQFPADAVFANDQVIQRWEDAIFQSQISYTWLRRYPSVFWSGLLHLAYFGYYPIVVFGPLLVAVRRGGRVAGAVLLGTSIAFVICYVTFVLYPVAGPNHLHPARQWLIIRRGVSLISCRGDGCHHARALALLASTRRVVHCAVCPADRRHSVLSDALRHRCGNGRRGGRGGGGDGGESGRRTCRGCRGITRRGVACYAPTLCPS